MNGVTFEFGPSWAKISVDGFDRDYDAVGIASALEKHPCMRCEGEEWPFRN